MTFEELMIFMLVSLKNSTSSSLRRFFENLGKKNITMTQQSLSESRKKVNVWAFTYLFKQTALQMTEELNKKWHTYRECAIDGSKISLPAEEELREYSCSTLVLFLMNLQINPIKSPDA
jgi:predicted Holliday junction resolvase-like endonuclease